jgi:4-hydroxy-3-polyprenylbenzoate decarboxylase
MYRLMLHDKKTMGILFGSTQHGYFHYRRYEELNKPMEFAVAIGTEPVTPIVCGTRIPPGTPEVEVIGGVRGQPLELVPCETVEHFVPATAEIVIEGVMNPRERKDEGPFGEYTGYRAGDRAPRPVCHVTAITHRHNPILPVSCMGVPVDDWAALRPVHMGALLEDLQSRGFPIRGIYSPPEGTTNTLFVSTKVPYPHYPQNLAAAIWSSQAVRPLPYHVFIFDEDIDVTNIGEVIWAFSTRCHPERGIHKFAPMVGGSLIPFLTSQERKTLRGARVLFDCTWPKDWEKDSIPVKASFDVLWPEGIQERVLRRWREYGYQS